MVKSVLHSRHGVDKNVWGNLSLFHSSWGTKVFYIADNRQ